MQALSHFSATMIHLDAAIPIDQDQSRTLIEKRRGEGNAELHGRDGQAALEMRVIEIPDLDLLPSLRKSARFLELAPDDVDSTRILDWLAIMRRISFAIKIALTDDFARQGQPPRGLVEYLLDYQHALGASKSAKRSLGGLVCPADAARQLNRGQEICVVAMKHGARHNGFGKIKAPSCIRIEQDSSAFHLSVVREACVVTREKRIPFPGESKIERTRQPYPHRTFCLPRP